MAMFGIYVRFLGVFLERGGGFDKSCQMFDKCMGVLTIVDRQSDHF